MRTLSETAGTPLTRYPTPSSLEPRSRAERQRPWLRLAGLAILVKALLVALTLVAYGASPDPLTALGREWNQWDATHYLYLATHGYSATGDARNLIAFFPLYPAVISAVAAIGLPARLAALLVSNVAGVVAAIVLYELARTDGREKAAFRAAAFFLVFPTAYFLMVGYTEALFCALAFGAVLQARRQRWAASGMLGGLAAAARLTGVALLPVIVIEMILARRVLRPVWHAIVPPLLVLLMYRPTLEPDALGTSRTPHIAIEVTPLSRSGSEDLLAAWFGDSTHLLPGAPAGPDPGAGRRQPAVPRGGGAGPARGGGADPRRPGVALHRGGCDRARARHSARTAARAPGPARRR